MNKHEMAPGAQKTENEVDIFANRIANGVINAHVHPIEEIKETYGMNDAQFEVVKQIAFDEDGQPVNNEVREKLRNAIIDLKYSGTDFSNLTSRAIIDLIYKQFNNIN